MAAGANTVHPPSDSVSTVEPPTSHSHILALAGYSTTRAGFRESLRRRQTLGRQATAFPRLQESRPSTRLGQECSHSGPARPSQLPPALHLQQELGRSQPIRRAVGVPKPHTAGQEGSLGRQQGNTWRRISQVYQGRAGLAGEEAVSSRLRDCQQLGVTRGLMLSHLEPIFPQDLLFPDK